MTELDLHPTGPPAAVSRPEIMVVPDPEQDLFRRGREVLGKDAGGLVARLLKVKGGSVPKTRAAIEEASIKHDPKEFIGACLRQPRSGPATVVPGECRVAI